MQAQEFVARWVKGELGRKTKEASLSVREDGPISTLYSYAVPIASIYDGRFAVVSDRAALSRTSLTTNKHLRWAEWQLGQAFGANVLGHIGENEVPTTETEWEEVLVSFDARADGMPPPRRGFHGVHDVIKECRKCGRTYTTEQWEELPLLGTQIIPAWRDEPEEQLVLKNCECGSTLAVSSLGRTE